MAEALALEAEIVAQLAEQRDALEGLEAALEAGESAELEEMKQQLQEAVKELESALLDMTKERLLGMVDAAQPGNTSQAAHPEAVGGAGEGRDGNGAAASSDLAVQPGSTCRFRYIDGRWYNGLVVDCSASEATVQFLMPTKAYMLSGEAEIESVQAAQRTLQVVMHDSGQRMTVPRHAVAVSALADTSDNEGSQDARMPLDSSQDGPLDDQEEEPDEDAGDDAGDLDEYDDAEDEDAYRPIVFGRVSSAMSEAANAVAQAAEAGPQTDTAHFAAWETHTRGIGSKLLAGMGYIRGNGLGRAGRGVVAPLEVQMLRAGAGLGSAGGAGGTREGRKKRRRGGERSRRRKFAEQARTAKNAKHDKQQATELARGTPGIFAFINGSLGDKSEAAALQRAQHDSHDLRKAGRSHGRFKTAASEAPRQTPQGKPPDRKALVNHQDMVSAAQHKIARLQETGARNASDKVVSAQIARKLLEARQELANAVSAHATAEKAIHNKEKQKRWMKF
ncbi:hypothetical protein WJX72_011523 [[Myrmecia] bisecta]|uniref:G-patch domain-containing protein n=1 Tax=[Myrmecia] bisecta TaxID=41462 RepID=A0AAW1PTD8_9CHLO